MTTPDHAPRPPPHTIKKWLAELRAPPLSIDRRKSIILFLQAIGQSRYRTWFSPIQDVSDRYEIETLDYHGRKTTVGNISASDLIEALSTTTKNVFVLLWDGYKNDFQLVNISTLKKVQNNERHNSNTSRKVCRTIR